MTGPLAPLFAQVRDSFEKLRSAGRTSDILKVWCDDGTDALSAIERHVQDMETALRGLLVETEPEQHRGTEPHPERGACVWCDARAALPAREKGTECPAGHGSQCCGYPNECREALKEAR